MNLLIALLLAAVAATMLVFSGFGLGVHAERSRQCGIECADAGLPRSHVDGMACLCAGEDAWRPAQEVSR